jgi:hypothetical protein
MRLKYRYTILTCLFAISIQGQTIEVLMQNFNNDFVLTHAEMYEKEKQYTKPQGVEGQDYYVLPGGGLTTEDHNHVRIIDMSFTWINIITSQVKNDPSILNSFVNSNNFDFAAYILIASIFKIKLNAIEDSNISFILYYSNDDNFLRLSNSSSKINKKEDLLNIYWKEIKDSAVARIVSLVNIQYPIDKHLIYNTTTITSNFTEDKGGWRNNGKVSTTLEEGRLKVSNVDSSWEGVQRPLDELRIAPGQQLNISLDFDQGDTSANVRLYVQEQDAEGNHLSWNVINGKLQTRTYNYTYTIKTGHKAILRIDKSNTHLEETTHFYVDTIEVKLLDCTLDSDGDGTNDCEDRCPSIVGPSLGGVGFNNGCPFEVEHARDLLLPRN